MKQPLNLGFACLFVFNDFCLHKGPSIIQVGFILVAGNLSINLIFSGVLHQPFTLLFFSSTATKTTCFANKAEPAVCFPFGNPASVKETAKKHFLNPKLGPPN